MTFEVTILGSNSALPAHGRHPTSQILNFNERLFMIDCGEATQIQMQRYKVRSSKIEHIFISHLHGDHYFGLIGLLTSYNLNHRTTPLHIHGPEQLKDIIDIQLAASNTILRFPLEFHTIEPRNGSVIYKEQNLRVCSLEMLHRIPCSGFLFEELITESNIIKEKIAEYQIPYQDIPAIKKGKDWTSPNGRVIPNSELTFPRHEPRKYAFCTDTLYNEDLLPYIDGVDLLYHEATFDTERAERAIETFHTTSADAGKLAKKAMVKKLLIGHFSSRYREPEMESLLQEACNEFANTELALEGKTFQVG